MRAPYVSKASMIMRVKCFSTCRSGCRIPVIANSRSLAGKGVRALTSYQQMRQVYDLLRERLGYPLLLQGEAPRNALVEKFRTTPGAVLFATSSFWQGVDVQGEQLSCVIIDRLP